MSVFFITGCRVSAVTAACVGHLETDGVEHYLNVTENWCDRHGRPGQAAETPARFNSAGTQELCQNSGTVGRSVRGAGFRFLDDVGPDGMAVVLAPAGPLVPSTRAAPSWSSRDSSTWCGPSSPCQTSLKGGRWRIKD